ncbi:MAG: hypothetical protein WA821_12255 [Anaerolineales bacterium]
MQHKRVQILLEPGQRLALALRAKQTGRSVSDLVREFVQKGLEPTTGKQNVIETIRAHRQEMLARRAGKSLDLNLADVLNEMREERGDELNRN